VGSGSNSSASKGQGQGQRKRQREASEWGGFEEARPGGPQGLHCYIIQYNVFFISLFYRGSKGNVCLYSRRDQILACSTRSPEPLLENRQYCTVQELLEGGKLS